MTFQLSREQIRKRQELTMKLRQGTISPEDALELKSILEEEKEQANIAEDFIAVFAIAGLLMLIAVLLDDYKKKKKKYR